MIDTMGDFSRSQMSNGYEDDTPPATQNIRCRACKQHGFKWTWSATHCRWLLGNGFTIHKCPVAPITPREE